MGNLDTAQIEQLHAIGEYLQQIRLEQARSLEDIAAKTYIPLRILRALEAGQQDTLPEPVFVQGFIRRYGEALGLDGSTLAQSFPVSRQIVPEPEQNDDFGSSDVPLQQDASEPSRFADNRSPLLYGGAAVLLIAALYGLSRLFTQPQRPTPATVSTEAPAPAKTNVSPAPTPQQPNSSASTAPVSSSPTASPVSPATSPASSAAPKPSSASPVSVAVNLNDAAWLQVISDGNVTYEGTLPKGTKRTWTARQELTIVSGNAGAVSTAFNGGAAKVMGTTGQVEELTFTPQGSGTTAANEPIN